jgi:hypothetical protein
MNKTLLIALTISMSPFALAHELDQVGTQQPQRPGAQADILVVKTYKNDPSRVEVAKLSKKIPAGQKVENLKFQQIAMKSEASNIKVTSANEKEVLHSTSSWGWAGGGGIYVGPRGGIYGYRRGVAWGGSGYYGRGYYGGYGYPNYSYGYGYPNYGYGCASYYNNYGGCYSTPPVYVNNNYYGYQPYYGYYDNDCYYTYYQGGYYY